MRSGPDSRPMNPMGGVPVDILSVGDRGVKRAAAPGRACSACTGTPKAAVTGVSIRTHSGIMIDRFPSNNPAGDALP
jgi:hypothetical protein